MPRRIRRGLVVCCFASGHFLWAANSSFQMETASPRAYTAAYLGNGAIGVETTASGIDPARCYLAGVYDRSSGDVPRIAAVPPWNEFQVYDGLRWLNGAQLLEGARQYRQVLDMYDGVLRTSYLWSSGSKSLQLEVEEYVARDRPDAAAVRMIVTPQFAGPLGVRMPLENWPPPKRYRLAELPKLDEAAAKDPWLIWYPGRLAVRQVTARDEAHAAMLSLQAHALGYRIDVGEALALTWQGTEQPARLHRRPRGADVEVVFDAQPRKQYVFTKFVAFCTGDSGDRMGNAVAVARKLSQAGWDRLLRSHSAGWHEIWESDILVDNSPDLQRVLHSMLFYLLGSVRQGLDFSTPPMGLSSSGYYGHVFWDADTFLFPALAILHPEMAKAMVAFRSRTRQAAIENAHANGFRGAMYPWEAGPDGVEATPRFAGQNAKYENHINGDVALAAWQYWLATGDRHWLEQDCWPVLRDTADFWVSRVSYNSKLSRYEIGHVVAVKESDIGVSNDAYTNAVARRNLELAGAAAAAIHANANPKWKDVAGKLYVPASESALLWFPLEIAFSKTQTQQAIDFMLNHIRQGSTGAMMGGEFYPILAAQWNDRARLRELFKPLYEPYLRPPFNVIAETPHNTNTNFITGAGAFLQQFVFGYSGLRWGDRGLEPRFPPMLPPAVERLTLKGVTIRGKRQTLVFDSTAK